MSFVNFLVEKYAGGAVPQTDGTAYDGITLQDSRPTIVNSEIAYSGTNAGMNGTAGGSAQAGLSVDVDSLRQDDTASGPLLRADTFLDDGLNGIYIRAESNGVAEADQRDRLRYQPDHPGRLAELRPGRPLPLSPHLAAGHR